MQNSGILLIIHTYFGGKNVVPPKVDWAPTSMVTTNPSFRIWYAKNQLHQISNIPGPRWGSLQRSHAQTPSWWGGVPTLALGHSGLGFRPYGPKASALWPKLRPRPREEKNFDPPPLQINLDRRHWDCVCTMYIMASVGFAPCRRPFIGLWPWKPLETSDTHTLCAHPDPTSKSWLHYVLRAAVSQLATLVGGVCIDHFRNLSISFCYVMIAHISTW